LMVFATAVKGTVDAVCAVDGGAAFTNPFRAYFRAIAEDKIVAFHVQRARL